MFVETGSEAHKLANYVYSLEQTKVGNLHYSLKPPTSGRLAERRDKGMSAFVECNIFKSRRFCTSPLHSAISQQT